MVEDRSTSDTGRLTPSGINPDRPAAYLERTPPGEILREQLDYLIVHFSHSCTPGCADCARFQRVASELLQPFRSNWRFVRSLRTVVACADYR